MTSASMPQEKLEGRVGRPETPDAGRTASPAREPLVRQVIGGRYRVVDTLGAGSLGTVYLCDDIPEGRRVAVKVFRRDCAKDEEFMVRLRRQVKLAMSVQEDRPPIVAVSDCGRTHDGNAYLATEYLQGRTLKDIIRRGGPLEVQRALRLACHIAGALDAIHDRGLVHRDVRSDNVIILAAGEEEAAKLKGFEVGGLRDTPLVDHLIRAGVIPSNPEYTTPEDIEGDQLTARTDIYAFGVLLYEMLTGRVPFSASSPDGVLAKHLQEVPAPLGTFRRGIPSVLELRVKQALEKEPEKRPRYVGDVVNEYLCELAAEELLAEQARQRRGVFGGFAASIHRRLPRLRDASAAGGRPGLGWKVGAGVTLLAALSAAMLWVFWPPRTPAPTAARPPQPAGVPIVETPRPTSVRQVVPAPAPVVEEEPRKPPADAVAATEAPKAVSDTETEPAPARRPETTAPRPSAVPKEASLRPPGSGNKPPQSSRPPARVEPPSRPERQPTPARVAAPPPAPRQETPAPTRGTPDPTAIIDWLLGRPPGNE